LAVTLLAWKTIVSVPTSPSLSLTVNMTTYRPLWLGVNAKLGSVVTVLLGVLDGGAGGVTVLFGVLDGGTGVLVAVRVTVPVGVLVAVLVDVPVGVLVAVPVGVALAQLLPVRV